MQLSDRDKDRNRRNGESQKHAVIAAVERAMREIEAEIAAGCFPGSLSLKEVARRAGIHEKTFQNNTHRETTRERVRNWICEIERRLSSCDGRTARATGRELSETERLKSDLEEAVADFKAAKEDLNRLRERYAKLAKHMNMMFHKARQKEQTIQGLRSQVASLTKRLGDQAEVVVIHGGRSSLP